jgi:hypothetical protein
MGGSSVAPSTPPFQPWVIVPAVTVALAIGFVMFQVRGDKIVKCKSVMARYKVHALLHFTFFPAIYFATARNPVSETPQGAILAAKETSYIVTKAPVPLTPTISDKTAHVVEPSRIPGFGDHLCPGKNRIRLDIPKNGGLDIN